jgi:hypothetical protein
MQGVSDRPRQVQAFEALSLLAIPLSFVGNDLSSAEWWIALISVTVLVGLILAVSRWRSFGWLIVLTALTALAAGWDIYEISVGEYLNGYSSLGIGADVAVWVLDLSALVFIWSTPAQIWLRVKS